MKSYFDYSCATRIAGLIDEHYPFDGQKFADAIAPQLPELELKARVGVFAGQLRRQLPTDYPEALEVLRQSMGPELTEEKGMFSQMYYLMPFARFIEDYGLDYPEQSLAAIEHLTRRHTGECAIRPYLHHHYELTMKHVHRCVHSPSEHVRRLASEGIRIYLPWASAFRRHEQHPESIVAVVEHLADDPAMFVRTSVANNLNDISKKHPEFAVRTAANWLSLRDTPRTRRVINKGLRTLIKNRNPDALDIVGASFDPNISVVSVQLEPDSLHIGDSATIQADCAKHEENSVGTSPNTNSPSGRAHS